MQGVQVYFVEITKSTTTRPKHSRPSHPGGALCSYCPSADLQYHLDHRLLPISDPCYLDEPIVAVKSDQAVQISAFDHDIPAADGFHRSGYDVLCQVDQLPARQAFTDDIRVPRQLTDQIAGKITDLCRGLSHMKKKTRDGLPSRLLSVPASGL